MSRWEWAFILGLMAILVGWIGYVLESKVRLSLEEQVEEKYRERLARAHQAAAYARQLQYFAAAYASLSPEGRDFLINRQTFRLRVPERQDTSSIWVQVNDFLLEIRLVEDCLELSAWENRPDAIGIEGRPVFQYE